MKRIHRSIIALCLCLCLLLSGCGMLDFGGYFEWLGNMLSGKHLTNFSDMVYTRPDMDQFQKALDTALEQASTQKKIEKLVEAVNGFYLEFDSFYTNLSLSNIYYSQDLTSEKWAEEYEFCMSYSATVDAGLDSLYRALAKSPLRETLDGEDYFGEGFLEGYEGESIYDEVFTELLNQESALQSQYYSISGEAAAVEYYSEAYFTVYGTRLAEVFVELVKVRQNIAAYAGYGSYPEFAYEFSFGRDYSVSQVRTYLSDISRELVPLYKSCIEKGIWNAPVPSCSQKDTLDYLRTMAANMGGTVEKAFLAMEEGGLYDITYSPNKANTSFEVFLSSYYTPFIFLCPTNSVRDKLSFAHEFGHFCADYESVGSGAGVDVAEVFSQGMEYLSLCYVQDDYLAQVKMADSLRVFVEQAAYASFEHQVYSLQEPTVESVQSLYESIGKQYGFDYWSWDSRDYVCIPHFYVSPLYVISYVVSNDVALQLYAMERETQGAGLQCLTDNLTTMQSGLLAFVEETQVLTSPFDTGALEKVRQVLEQVLG